MFRCAIVCFVVCVIGQCRANTFRLGACPKVLVMKDIEFDKILGEWHVIQRFNPMATCTKLHFEKLDDGTYSVNETARPLGISFNIRHQLINGRKITFLRNDTKSIFRTNKDFAHFTLSTFGIIDTDYTNYALVWGCDPVLFGSVQNVDILSRKPDAQPELIKAARDILKDMAIDYTPMDNVDQSNCSNDTQTTPGTNDHVDTHNMMIA